MTEKMVKVTKRMNIQSLLAREDLSESERKYLLHELELINKKNAYKSKEEIAKESENIKLEQTIFSILQNSGVGKTCSAIAIDCSASFNKDFTPQRITPRLKSLVEDGKLEVYKEKGFNYYKVVGA